MTPEQIADEYMRRETAMTATPQGQDVQLICREVAEMCGRDWREVHDIVIEHTILRAG